MSCPWVDRTVRAERWKTDKLYKRKDGDQKKPSWTEPPASVNQQDLAGGSSFLVVSSSRQLTPSQLARAPTPWEAAAGEFQVNEGWKIRDGGMMGMEVGSFMLPRTRGFFGKLFCLVPGSQRRFSAF